jgi:hypothetical protein
MTEAATAMAVLRAPRPTSYPAARPPTFPAALPEPPPVGSQNGYEFFVPFFVLVMNHEHK